MRKLLWITLATVLWLIGAGGSSAQQMCDGGWRARDGIPGANGFVSCSTMWDPDGSGPRSPLLVLGGNFTVIGNVQGNHIAAIDLNTGEWSTFGIGMDGIVDCLAAGPNGELYAGGRFTSAGGQTIQHIARWNGQSWVSLANGSYGGVYAVSVLPNGHLCAGGELGLGGNNPVGSVGIWNGTAWTRMGLGLTGVVHDILVLPSGEIVVGGQLLDNQTGVPALSVAIWNGTSWSSLGPRFGATTPPPLILTLHRLPNGDIVAGGDIYQSGTNSPVNILRFNGATWNTIGTGLPRVYCLGTTPAGELIAGGTQDMRRWNGTAWTFAGINTGGQGVYTAITVPGGDLVVGGAFNRVEQTGATCIARWSGQAWSALADGVNYQITSLARGPNGNIFAGGSFAVAGGQPQCGFATRFNGRWVPRPSIAEYCAPYNGGVASVQLLPNGDVFALRSTSSSTVQLSRWNGADWMTMFSGPFSGLTPTRSAVLADGSIVVAGSFSAAGAVAANNIARWNGTEWSAYGAGLDVWASDVAVMPNGNVLAAGYFHTPSAPNGAGVVMWDGQQWSALGDEPFGWVDRVFVAPSGDVLAAAHTSNLTGVFRWNGSMWSRLGGSIGGPTSYGYVQAIAVRPNNDIVIGGSFAQAEGRTVNYIALWNGAAWLPLGSGVDASVSAILAMPNGDIAVGGQFISAGGQVASRYAEYHFGDTTPTIVSPPQPAAACPSGSAMFDVAAAGSDAFSYQWQIRTTSGMWSSLGMVATDIGCGARASAASPNGRATSVAVIPCANTGVLAPQQFRLRCIVTNACSTLTSAEGIYTTCPADFNCSGSLSAQDIFDFLSAWFAYDPRADVNHSGGTSVQDILDYLAAWFNGC